MTRRVGILGGTFDPIHQGHLNAGVAAQKALGLSPILVMPSHVPPHRRMPVASAFHRFAMVALATAPVAHFRTSTIELDSLARRYTVETLELMQHIYPGSQLIFVLGTDMFEEIESWKDYRRLFDLAHLVIVNRPGFPFRDDVAPFQVLAEDQNIFLPDKPAVFYMPFVRQPISSTQIRDKYRSGQQARQWVPPPVGNYIERHKLYL